jgi:DNA polymerase-1
MRNFAERAAINAPIQGSAADLIKIAMIQIQQDIELTGLKSVMTMQVHDELVFDAPIEEEEKLEEIVRKGMEEVCALKVPLIADVSKGESWFKG